MRYPTTERTRHALRRQQRGAALVEAAVIIPVMVVFLGVMQFAYYVTSGTMEAQRVANRNALDAASHDCVRGSVQGRASLTSPVTVPREGNRNEIGKNESLDVRQMQATRAVDTVTSGGGRTRAVSVSATYDCNPAPYTENYRDWFDWGFANYRNGGN